MGWMAVRYISESFIREADSILSLPNNDAEFGQRQYEEIFLKEFADAYDETPFSTVVASDIARARLNGLPFDGYQEGLRFLGEHPEDGRHFFGWAAVAIDKIKFANTVNDHTFVDSLGEPISGPGSIASYEDGNFGLFFQGLPTHEWTIYDVGRPVWTDASETINFNTADMREYLVHSNDFFMAGSGHDTALLPDSVAAAVRWGFGQEESDTSVQGAITHFLGGGGNDTITGGRFIELLDGESGNDRIFGNSSADILHGGSGSDLLDGGSGNDLLSGGDDAPSDTGLPGNDTLKGGAGADQLNGDDGNDHLDGGTGADVMQGGLDNDTYVVDDPGDQIEDLQGFDTVNSTVSHTLSNGLDALLLRGADEIAGTGNDLANTITGNNNANTIEGGGGTDRLSGRAGGDAVLGGDNADALFGEAGADTLDGGAGADRLDGGFGADTLTGGSEGDLFLFAGAWGFDTITDWQDTAGSEAGQDGLDRISLRALSGANDVDALNDLLLAQVGADVRITLDLDHNGVSDSRDLDGNGTLDSVRITLLNATALNFGNADFLF